MEVKKKEYKVCNDKDCEHQGRPQSIENFGYNKNTADGRNSKCKRCINRAAVKYYKKKGASKIVKKVKESPLETHPPLDNKFENMVKPLYSYLINTPVEEGIIQFNHTLGEIVMFFEIPQRAAMEAILVYIAKAPGGGGYKWVRKPKDLKEFTETLKSRVPDTRMQKEPHNAVLYEQMQVFMERMLAVEQKIDLILEQLL